MPDRLKDVYENISPTEEKKKVDRIADVYGGKDSPLRYAEGHLLTNNETVEVVGFLNNLFNMLNFDRYGIASYVMTTELGKKQWIRDTIQKHESKLSKEDRDLLLSVKDEDWWIEPIIPKDAKYTDLWGEGGDQIKLKATVATSKEFEEKLKKRPVKKLIKKVLKQAPPEEEFRRPEFVSAELKEIPLGITFGEFKKWADTIPEGETNSWKKLALQQAYKDAITPFASLKIQRHLVGEKPVIELDNKTYPKDYVAYSKMTTPHGHPARPFNVLAGWFTEVTAPSPFDLAAIGTGKVAKLASRVPAVDRMYKALYSFSGTKWFMDWFQILPEDMKAAKYTAFGGKAMVGPAKTKVGKEVLELGDVLKKAAKEKGKVLNPHKMQGIEEQLVDWFYHGSKESTRSGQTGIQLLTGWLEDTKKPLSEFFNDTKIVSELTGIPKKQLDKYIWYGDMRDMIMAFEQRRLAAEFGDEAADAITHIRNELEAFKLEAGLIPPVEAATEAEYFARRAIGQQKVKGTAFKTTSFKAPFMRKRVNRLYEDFEKALITGHSKLPDTNIFRILLADAEDTLNSYMQKNVIDKLYTGGVLHRIRKLQPIKKKDKAWKVVKRYSDYIDLKTVNKDNVIRKATEVLDSPKRIEDALNSGARSVDVLNAKVVEDALGVTGMGKKWGFYFPESKLRFYPSNIKDEINKALRSKKLAGLTDTEVTKINKILDDMSSIIRIDDPKVVDFEKLYELANSAILKRVAPKTTAQVTSRVPMYMTPRYVSGFIKQQTRTVLDPSMRAFFRYMRYIARPFQGAVTTWNPAFWTKYLATDTFQLWKGGVEAYNILPRFIQGAKIMTGKGTHVINGVEFTSRQLLDVMDAAGVRRHIRSLMASDDADALGRVSRDLMQHSIAGRKFLRAFGAPGRALSHVDDSFRGGLWLDYISKEAKEKGLKTQDEILGLAPRGAFHTWFHMFNYDDMGPAMKQMRAFVPFLSWKQHIIPDMTKFMFRLDKMRKFANAHLAMEGLLGIPDTRLAADYIKKSPNLKWEQDGKIINLKSNLPIYMILNFKELTEYMGGMAAMTHPIFQLLINWAGKMQTFPTLETEKEYTDPKNQVPMPLSMYLFHDAVKNTNWWQRKSHVQPIVEHDEDNQSTVTYLSVNKRARDIWHGLMFLGGPLAILPVLDYNLPNFRLFIDPEQQYQGSFPTEQELRALRPDTQKQLTMAKYKGHPSIGYIEGNKRFMSYEHDINEMTHKSIMRWRNLSNRLPQGAKAIMGGQPDIVKEQIGIPNGQAWLKQFAEFNLLTEAILAWMADNPSGIALTSSEIQQRAELMQKHAVTIRAMLGQTPSGF